MKSVLLIVFLIVISSCFAQTVSKEKMHFDELFKKVSNGGKWGKDDKKGTVNYIDNQKILNALKIPQKGVSVSLSFDISLDSTQINHSDFDEITTYKHQADAIEYQGYDWATDTFSIAYHGYTVSHMDGLAHLGQNGKLYNGYDATKMSPQGFDELGIEAYNEGIISRGILIDIPLLYGKDYLEAGKKISIKDIENFEKKYDVSMAKGDIVLIRTGRWSEKKEKGDWDSSLLSAGLDYRVAELLSEREVAVLGADGTNDVQPSNIPEESSPVHKLALVAMGMPLLDNLNLEEIAKEAQRQNKWEFMVSVQPLRFKGGTGSPVNAVAIF